MKARIALSSSCLALLSIACGVERAPPEQSPTATMSQQLVIQSADQDSGLRGTFTDQNGELRFHVQGDDNKRTLRMTDQNDAVIAAWEISFTKLTMAGTFEEASFSFSFGNQNDFNDLMQRVRASSTGARLPFLAKELAPMAAKQDGVVRSYFDDLTKLSSTGVSATGDGLGQAESGLAAAGLCTAWKYYCSSCILGKHHCWWQRVCPWDPWDKCCDTGWINC